MNYTRARGRLGCFQCARVTILRPAAPHPEPQMAAHLPGVCPSGFTGSSQCPLHASFDVQSCPSARFAAHLPAAPAPPRSHQRPKAQSPAATHAVPVPGRSPHLPITHDSPGAHDSDLLHTLPGGTRGWHVVPSQNAPAAQAGWCSADAVKFTRLP